MGILLLNLLVACIVWLSLQNSKTHYEERANATARSISRVLEEHLSNIFEKVDLALQAAIDEAERQQAGGVIVPEVMNSFIIRLHSRLPELLVFRATDASGDAIYGPEVKAATTTSLAHRDYFKFLRDNPTAGMVISKPIVGGISGKWMVIFARGYHRPDGAFAGLVYAGLGLEYLTKIFNELNVGVNGSITLLDDEPSIVACYPWQGSASAEPGLKISSPQLLDQINSGKISSTFTEISFIDGVERLFSYNRLSFNQRFYIIAGLSPIDYLAGWRSEVYKMSFFWAAFCFSIVIFAWMFYGEWNRTRKAEKSLHILNEELEQTVLDRTKSAEHANQVLQAVIDCMSDWVWEVDVEGRYTYCSPKVEKYLGYRPDEMIGKAFYDFMNDEESRSTRIAFRELAKQKLQIINLENWCIAKDGSMVLFSTNAVPIINETGDMVGYSGVDTDITERRQMEENLRISEERYRMITENAADVIWTMDIDGRFTYVSPSVTKLLGYDTPSEFTQLSFDDILCPDSLPTAKELMAKNIADIKAGLPISTFHIELEHLNKSGSTIWTDITINSRYDSNGDFQEVIGVTHDISELKQRELEIKQQSSLINALLDSIPDIIFFKDVNSVYLGCNPIFAEFVGKSRDEIVGCTDYDLFNKENADFFRDQDKRVMELGEMQHKEEWIIHPDGRKALLHTIKAPYLGQT